MPLRLTSIVFEASDPEGLADFWSNHLPGWEDTDDGDEVRFVPTEEWGDSLDVVFTPGAARPKTGKNRIHLDLPTEDMSRYRFRREWYPKLGATPADIGQGDLVPWTVFADPEGNEFCLLRPRDRYSASSAIAAIVVDCGDPELLATFWSAATGWPIVESEKGFAALRTPGNPPRGPFLELFRVAKRNPEPSRVSLGFESYWPHQHEDDLAGLLALGARVLRRHDGDVSYTTLADPEGNEFRVVIPVWPPKQ